MQEVFAEDAVREDLVKEQELSEEESAQESGSTSDTASEITIQFVHESHYFIYPDDEISIQLQLSEETDEDYILKYCYYLGEESSDVVSNTGGEEEQNNSIVREIKLSPGVETTLTIDNAVMEELWNSENKPSEIFVCSIAS